MKQQDQAEILQYLEKFSGSFNNMMSEVLERILKSQVQQDFNPLKLDDQVNASQKHGQVKVDSAKFVKQQLHYLEKQQRLWQSASKAMMGEKVDPVVIEEKNDKRFEDDDWNGNPMFSYIKQAYLLNAEYLHELVSTFEFEDDKTADQVRFYTRQFVNSMSPSNYVLTNPEVCREILETQGQNLARGIDNFMRDLENSPNEAFKITQVDLSAFNLGVELANTEGKVVYENDLIQLIQYSPKTDSVFEVPLLIIPPFINKYYILDLNERKSLVKWLVEQGFTVFMISWANPGEELAHLEFDDYVRKGVVAALDAVERLSKSSKVNVAGYCVGGTLLGVSQSYLKSINDNRIASLTFLTTLFDFSEPGEVGNYISDSMYPFVEQHVKNKGYFDGRILALSFSLLRENNLFWSFFIENYLKGKDPTPFDILYWNSDSTNIPGNAYLFYLQNMYIDNKLVQPGALTACGKPIDLSSLDVPCYCLAAMADHIVLWSAAYRSAKLLGENVRFVLTESGHVAGVVNPADKGKYPHWVNDDMTETHQDWLAGARQVSGSWWNDWCHWLGQQSGGMQPNRDPENQESPPIEDAPGRYVKVRLEKIEVPV